MNPSSSFLRTASICCFLSVITTLGIHIGFPDPPADFEQRVFLFKNSVYIFNCWWIIFHCLLVVFSMWGMCLVLLRASPGFAGIGFLFFAVFSIAEITRQMYVLFYVNGLREQYVLATDPAMKQIIRNALSSGGLLLYPLFGVFILSFGLGNFFYGISLSRQNGISKIVSLLLIVWSMGNFTALGNEFWKVNAISSFLGIYSYTYQPLMRLLLAIWLWRKSSRSVY